MRATAGFMRDSPFKKNPILNTQKISAPVEEGSFFNLMKSQLLKPN